MLSVMLCGEHVNGMLPFVYFFFVVMMIMTTMITAITVYNDDHKYHQYVYYAYGGGPVTNLQCAERLPLSESNALVTRMCHVNRCSRVLQRGRTIFKTCFSVQEVAGTRCCRHVRVTLLSRTLYDDYDTPNHYVYLLVWLCVCLCVCRFA